MIQEIKNFIDILTTRINLLNTMGDNLESSKVKELNRIIDKYGSLDSNKFDYDEINTIANILRIDINDSVLQDSEKLDQIIKDYIDGYNGIKNTHEENSNNEINIYQKYINLLSSDSKEMFTDFYELDDLMDELGMFVGDKWKIISYLNKRNIDNNSTNILAMNLNSKLLLFNKLYLSDENLKNMINDYIKDKSIELSMIPGIADKLSNSTYDKGDVQNALSTLILNELHQQLIESDEDNYENLEEMVNVTLGYISSFEDTIIAPSRDIIVTYDQLLMDEINKGNDINDYMNISIDDINNLVQDREKALTLKRLPIIKSMKDTLVNMSECDRTSDEYVDYIRLLSNLNEAYKEIKES